MNETSAETFEQLLSIIDELIVSEPRFKGQRGIFAYDIDWLRDDLRPRVDALAEEMEEARSALDVYGGRPAILRTEKVFESGLKIKAGAFLSVQETTAGYIGHYRPDGASASTHCFALEDDEFMWLTRRKSLAQS